MKTKNIPTCPSCNAELDHVQLTYDTVYTFSAKHIKDDECDWNDCVEDGEFENMYFWCPNCDTRICENSPDAMIEFLLGKDVEFTKREFGDGYDCIASNYRVDNKDKPLKF